MADPRSAALIDRWLGLLKDSHLQWVLFQHGTCVTLDPSEPEPARRAADLMEDFGKVVPGTDAGDFDVIKLDLGPGWIVTCHHPSIRTYVGPDDLPTANPSEVLVGLAGRSMRDLDARKQQIIYVHLAGD